MTARILVVDDISTNVKLLEARLTAEYFDVVSAMNGREALSICRNAQCDIVLLDVMMPEMDGFEVCRQLKADPDDPSHPGRHGDGARSAVPIACKGLEAGADDFLTKPVSEIALLTRVRSLVRLKLVSDELRMRAATSRQIGISDPVAAAIADTGKNGRVLLVDDRESSYERIARVLSAEHGVDIEPDPQEALVSCGRRRIRSDDRLALAAELRRAAPLQPGPHARAHAPSAAAARRRSAKTARG